MTINLASTPHGTKGISLWFSCLAANITTDTDRPVESFISLSSRIKPGKLRLLSLFCCSQLNRKSHYHCAQLLIFLRFRAFVSPLISRCCNLQQFITRTTMSNHLIKTFSGNHGNICKSNPRFKGVTWTKIYWKFRLYNSLKLVDSLILLCC